MRTTIDTNVLSEVLGKGPEALLCAEALTVAAGVGPLAISSVVYAELAAASQDPHDLGTVLDQMRVTVQERYSLAAAERAAIAWKQYTAARRRQPACYFCSACGSAISSFACPACGEGIDGGPRHLLADFLIGSQAVVEGARLLTMEHRGGKYRRYFPELVVISPRDLVSDPSRE